ncbi:MAG: tail fiber domain-containing protein [Balneolaceae bacterium]
MMNKLLSKLILTVAALLFATDIMAQVPQGFNFQAVARDADGELLANSNLGVRISVLQGAEDGTAVYTETQTPTTNDVGTFQLIIGEGTSEDPFDGVNWAGDNYYVKLEIDPAGGTEYEELGITRLLSVPYALLSQNVVNGISAGEEGITEYHLNSSQGDTSFIVNATGATSLAGIQSTASTESFNRGVVGRALSTSSNTENQYGLQGHSNGDGTGAHIGVMGNATTQGATSGNRYGVYGYANSKSRYNFGIQAIAQGEGDGTIVPLGEESGDGFGSYNIAGYFSSSGNLNGNVGVEAQAVGGVGERADFGVLGRATGFNNSPNIGVRSEAYNSPISNVAFEGDVSGSSHNLGLRLNVHNGSSNVGMEVNADTAAILNGHSVINGDLTVHGTINSGDFGSGTSSVSAKNDNGDIVGSMSSFEPDIKQGFLHLYGETAAETDDLRAGLEINDNGSGDSWGRLFLNGPVEERHFVEAFVSNDPENADPDGWSGQFNLWGTNSPNIEMRGKDWESADLPQITLFGNKPTGDWYYSHANLSVNEENGNEWGSFSLMANNEVPNFQFSAKGWESGELPVFEMFGSQENIEGGGYFSHLTMEVNEDGEQQWTSMTFKGNNDNINIEIGAYGWEVDGANRPYMSFRGNTPDENLILMEVIDDGTSEFGGVNFRSTDGTELSINAHGINGNTQINGNLHVDGEITHTGDISQTSDRNLKENIQPLQSGLATIMKLNPTSYNFRGNGNYNGLKLSTSLHYGLIAQEVEEVLPSLVKDNIHTYSETESLENGPSMNSEVEVTKEMSYKTMNYTELIPVLVKAVQEQQEEIERLQKKLNELKNNK